MTKQTTQELTGCEMGCVNFTCGSIGHQTTCVNYPESMQQMINEKDKEILELRKEVERLNEKLVKDIYQMQHLVMLMNGQYDAMCVLEGRP